MAERARVESDSVSTPGIAGRRVLFVVPSLGHGGAERTCVELASRLAERGWQVAIATVAGTDRDFYPLPATATRFSLGLQRESGNLLSGVLNNWRRVRALRRVVDEYDPQVVVALTTRVNVLALLAARRRGVPVVVSERVHPPSAPQGIVWEWLRNRTYPAAHAVVAQTSRSAEWLRENAGINGVTVIPNCVWAAPAVMDSQVLPESIVNAASEGTDRAHGPTKVLLAIGRLMPQKGFDRLIPAFRQACAPDWMLVILGEGPERERLQALAADARDTGSDASIVLPGVAGNVADWYERAELFVLSSRFEGFPNVLLEALAAGLPVVAFDCPTGVREMVRDGENGWLVPPDDKAALTAALGEAMADDAERAARAATARQSVECFSEVTVVAQWHALLANLCSGVD